MFGIRRAMTSPPGFTIDQFRHLRELMPPVAYLSWTYYEGFVSLMASPTC